MLSAYNRNCYPERAPSAIACGRRSPSFSRCLLIADVAALSISVSIDLASS